ncbi:AMP-binding protein [Streptomyces anulatus]|uniref:AMP-binding protein n=1 Tax=Streptomyces anulatus TaxID=1892 RepID=UPI001678B216|nr:AMP-binding protein [Streptomyces anulatus]
MSTSPTTVRTSSESGTWLPASSGGPDAPGPRHPAEGEAALRGSVRDLPDLSVTALIRSRNLPPERPAAVQGAVRVPRGELLATSAASARVLVAEGCGREVPVAVLLPRGPDALTAILAVLEAGGAYVPLSCDQPLDQLRAIRDSRGSITCPDSHRRRLRPPSLKRREGSDRRIRIMAATSSWVGGSTARAAGSSAVTVETGRRAAADAGGACVLPCGTGSSPRSTRDRTSAAVPSEMPASLAIWRSGVWGRALMSSPADLRPSMLLRGRRLPSRPIRTFSVVVFSAKLSRRMALIDLAARPVASAMARSDHWGWERRIRAAAARRPPGRGGGRG